jgi:hypothetical protein
MREILFRGKRVDNGEWVTGSLFKEECSDACNIMGFNYYNSTEGLQRDPFDYVVIPETVGQYTGLKDKNGKEIYENDIVKFDDEEPNEWWVEYKASRGQFDLRQQYHVSGLQHAKYAEVISDIHEHPEILKGGNSNG